MKSLSALLMGIVLFMSGHARAEVLALTFTGTIVTATATSASAGVESLPGLFGTPFQESFSFDLSQGDVVRGPFPGQIDAHQALLPGPDYPYPTGPVLGSTSISITPATFHGSFLPSTYAFAGAIRADLTFMPGGLVTASVDNGFLGHASMGFDTGSGLPTVGAFQAFIIGTPRADDQTTLDLGLRITGLSPAAVPLPPSMPMFAAAVLVLGGLGAWRKVGGAG